MILLLFLVSILVFMRLMLPQIVFVPTAKIAATPAAIGLPFDDVFFTTSDEVRLNAWYIPAQGARATLLFFHGNAGNISHRLDSIKIFNDLGLSVFIIDYRGYGRSESRPSIPGVTFDALGAWKWLTEEKKIPPEKIVVFGRSLGGAIAMELMRHVEPRALI
jgi:alpha-beta hydrolase superfamily lysophospholipase